MMFSPPGLTEPFRVAEDEVTLAAELVVMICLANAQVLAEPPFKPWQFQ